MLSSRVSSEVEERTTENGAKKICARPYSSVPRVRAPFLFDDVAFPSCCILICCARLCPLAKQAKSIGGAGGRTTSSPRPSQHRGISGPCLLSIYAAAAAACCCAVCLQCASSHTTRECMFRDPTEVVVPKTQPLSSVCVVCVRALCTSSLFFADDDPARSRQQSPPPANKLECPGTDDRSRAGSPVRTAV